MIDRVGVCLPVKDKEGREGYVDIGKLTPDEIIDIFANMPDERKTNMFLFVCGFVTGQSARIEDQATIIEKLIDKKRSEIADGIAALDAIKERR